MALKLRLRPRERVVINGCVLQNENRRYTLTIDNFAQIIRGSEIMREDEASTPVRRAYFLIQNMLLDPAGVDECAPAVSTLMAKLYVALGTDEMRDNIMRAMRHVGERDYYKALACVRPVISHEDRVLGVSRPEPDEVRAEG